MEREVVQMEDIVEPSQELERDDSHVSEFMARTVSQVMGLKENEDHFVPRLLMV